MVQCQRGMKNSRGNFFRQIRANALVWLGALIIALPVCAADNATKLLITNIVRTSPRLLRIFVVEAQVGPGALHARTIIAADPDGDGPAEAAMTSPVKMAKDAGAMAAINANVASRMPADAAKKPMPGWSVGLPVTIGGWARSRGVTRSGPDQYHAPSWIGTDERFHVGDTNVPPDAPEAFAGFTEILRDGEPKHPSGSRATSLHPRSAIGTDATGHRVWLVVVDGRQPKLSEGMTEAELGVFMKELGATDAVNLDGGGSSILLADADGKGLKVLNKPCEGRPRPIPVLLGIFATP